MNTIKAISIELVDSIVENNRQTLFKIDDQEDMDIRNGEYEFIGNISLDFVYNFYNDTIIPELENHYSEYGGIP